MKTAFLFLVLAGLVHSGSAACANDCSGNGRCNAHSACECYRNWMGNDCSQRVCFFGRAFVDTPAGDLNSDGQVGAAQNVMAMSGNTPSHELFDESYSLGDVSVGSFNEAHFYAECSGKGSCQRESGLCECFTGYEGEGCTRVSCASSTGETCSGHGVCLRLSDTNSGPMRTYASWDSHKTQQCNCDPLYTGIACDQRSCPSGDDPVTKSEHVTMLCGEWGLKSQVKNTGLDPSQQINSEDYAYENMDVFGTVSGASAKLSFFCGVPSSDVSSRKLSTNAENLLETACNAHHNAADCATALCGWQAAVTRTTPEFNTERCITVQGVTGLFTLSDSVVLGDSTYLLNDTVRIAYKYREELKQANEVQTIVLKGSVCERGSCVYDKSTGQCMAGDPAGLGFQSAAEATCGAASAGSEAPFLTTAVPACTAGSDCTLCTAISYNKGTGCTGRNPFALTFTSEYGSSFTTRSIECANYDALYPTTEAVDDVNADINSGIALLAERMATAEHCRELIESALEDLPNSALVDVDVRDQKIGSFNDPQTETANNIITWTPSGKRSAVGNEDHFLDVSFISNTGDVTMMTVIGQDTEANSVEEGMIHHSTHYTEPEVTISEKAKGTTDNYVCSNRGVCDYSAGTCKCFQGFTRQDCSLQNVLAMY